MTGNTGVGNGGGAFGAGFTAGAVTVQNLGSDAGFHNSYGYVRLDDAGQPTQGQVIWADIQAGAGETFTIEGADADHVLFFLIPDGARQNASLDDGDAMVSSSAAVALAGAGGLVRWARVNGSDQSPSLPKASIALRRTA